MIWEGPALAGDGEGTQKDNGADQHAQEDDLGARSIHVAGEDPIEPEDEQRCEVFERMLHGSSFSPEPKRHGFPAGMASGCFAMRFESLWSEHLARPCAPAGWFVSRAFLSAGIVNHGTH